AVNTGNEGRFWLREIKSRFPETAVVMITAYAAIDLAVQSLKSGAADFIVKPWQNEQLLNTLSEALNEKLSKTSSSVKPIKTENPIIGNSAIMEDLQYKISKIAPSDANILILVEKGSGIDLIALTIHKLYMR